MAKIPPGKHTKPEDVRMTQIETINEEGDVEKVEGYFFEDD